MAATSAAGRGKRGGDVGAQGGQGGGVQQVGLVQHHEIGAVQLVEIDLGQRVVVVEGLVRRTLGGDGSRIVGEAAVGDGRAIHHGDHAVHRHAVADGGPAERLQQRFRQCKAGGLDDDVLGWGGAVEQRLHRRQEFVGDGAAEAAIGQLHHILAAGNAATAQHVAVDAERAELVDDDGDAPAAGIGEDMAHQRRLAGAEEAGDDGAGDLARGAVHAGILPRTMCASEAARRDGSTVPVGCTA